MPVVATARPLGQPTWVQILHLGLCCVAPGKYVTSVSQLHLETGDPRSAHFTVGGGMAEPQFHSECTDQGLVQAKPPGRCHHLPLII